MLFESSCRNCGAEISTRINEMEQKTINCSCGLSYKIQCTGYGVTISNDIEFRIPQFDGPEKAILLYFMEDKLKNK